MDIPVALSCMGAFSGSFPSGFNSEAATPSSLLDGAAKGKWVWWQATLSFPLSWRLGAGPAALGTAKSAFARSGGESFFEDTRHDRNCCITLQA